MTGVAPITAHYIVHAVHEREKYPRLYLNVVAFDFFSRRKQQVDLRSILRIIPVIVKPMAQNI